MRHGVAFRKLGRPTAHRMHMLRNLVGSLIKSERIVTTLPKAKETQRLADKMITFAKRDTFHSKLQAKRFLFEGTKGKSDLFKKLVTDLAPRYTKRAGGYTRVIKLEPRIYDKAKMAVLEYVDNPLIQLRKPRLKRLAARALSRKRRQAYLAARLSLLQENKLTELQDVVDRMNTNAPKFDMDKPLREYQAWLKNSGKAPCGNDLIAVAASKTSQDAKQCDAKDAKNVKSSVAPSSIPIPAWKVQLNRLAALVEMAKVESKYKSKEYLVRKQATKAVISPSENVLRALERKHYENRGRKARTRLYLQYESAAAYRALKRQLVHERKIQQKKELAMQESAEKQQQKTGFFS